MPNLGTNDTVGKFLGDVYTNITLCIFYDLKKAFDTIDHSFLFYKLVLMGFEDSTISLLKNYLTGRQQVCLLNGTTSELSIVVCGVPQGST